jgi:hypothetical protein
VSLSTGQGRVMSRRPLSLLEQARRIGGQDPDGWMLYRIVKESR